MTRKRCSRCYHELPAGKTTWRPRWDWWPEGGGPRLTYASDGPPLGYVLQFTDEPGPSAPFFNRKTDKPGYRWEAWVLEEPPARNNRRWPYMKRIGSSRSKSEAKKMVETAVRTGGLWP